EQKVKKAEAEKQKIIHQAEAARYEKVTRAAAYREAFLKRSQARKILDFDQEWELFAGALAAPLDGTRATDAERTYQQRRREMIAAQEKLTEFRLFWDTVSGALKDRDLVLIDAENVPGRRHLWLTDPDLLRPPAPIFMQPQPALRSELHKEP